MSKIDPRIAKYKKDYPTHCAHCHEELDGVPDDEALTEQLAEHDKLFPGGAFRTMDTICDPCFQMLCPGGNLISMD